MLFKSVGGVGVGWWSQGDWGQGVGVGGRLGSGELEKLGLGGGVRELGLIGLESGGGGVGGLGSGVGIGGVVVFFKLP